MIDLHYSGGVWQAPDLRPIGYCRTHDISSSTRPISYEASFRLITLQGGSGVVYLGYCDPCGVPSAAGWPLRNLLALVAYTLATEGGAFITSHQLPSYSDGTWRPPCPALFKEVTFSRALEGGTCFARFFEEATFFARSFTEATFFARSSRMPLFCALLKRSHFVARCFAEATFLARSSRMPLFCALFEDATFSRAV